MANILNIRGYFDRHLELCKIEKTQQDAYDRLEEEYKKMTEVNRYISYESFRVAKSKYFKKNRW